MNDDDIENLNAAFKANEIRAQQAIKALDRQLSKMRKMILKDVVQSRNNLRQWVKSGEYSYSTDYCISRVLDELDELMQEKYGSDIREMFED